MPDEPIPPTLVDDRLPDWWRPLTLNLDGDHLALRRAGVKALREGLSHDKAVDAVCYAHGDRVAGERIIDDVRAAARTADGAFAGDAGDAEPPALVAAAVADQLATAPTSDLSTLVSLLVCSAAFGGHAPVIEGMALVDYAIRQLEHVGAWTRGTATLRNEHSAAQSVASALNEAAVIPTTGGGLTDTAANAALASHADILKELGRRVDALTRAAAHEQAVLREQLGQHTWVLESWCGTASDLWVEVPPDARPLVAAVELADRTRGNAPAIGAENLLGSLLAAAGGGIGTPLASVGGAAPLIAGHFDAAPNAMLFPISTAIARYRERNGAATWKTAAKGVLPTHSRPGVELAVQGYREAMALRILGHA